MLELTLSDSKAVGCQTARLSVDGVAICDYAVCHIVLDRRVTSGRSDKVRKLTQQGRILTRAISVQQVGSGGADIRGGSDNGKLSSGVPETSGGQVDSELEVAKEIRTQDRIADVSNDEDPFESASET